MASGARIRLTKEFRFEAAHFLPGYDGLCANVHGHSYVLRVTVRGHAQEEQASPKRGMVLDFSVLKPIVEEEVVSLLDHSLMVRSDQTEVIDALAGRFRVVRFDFQPTCENLLPWMAARIARRLPAQVELVSLRLNETATSYAEWLASDQT